MVASLSRGHTKNFSRIRVGIGVCTPGKKLRKPNQDWVCSTRSSSSLH
jgi:peptidyl-tRNA hydrolase